MFPGVRSNSRCAVFLSSYLMSSTGICLIDVIYLKHVERTLLPSDFHTRCTYRKQAHHCVRALPSVHDSQLWHFFFLGSFTFSELCRDNSHSLSLLPPLYLRRDAARWQHPSAITYHLVTGVLERGILNKSHIHFQELVLKVPMCLCVCICTRFTHSLWLFFIQMPSLSTHAHTCLTHTHTHRNSLCPCHMAVTCVIAWPPSLLAYVALMLH